MMIVTKTQMDRVLLGVTSIFLHILLFRHILRDLTQAAKDKSWERMAWYRASWQKLGCKVWFRNYPDHPKEGIANSKVEGRSPKSQFLKKTLYQKLLIFRKIGGRRLNQNTLCTRVTKIFWNNKMD